MKPKNLKFPFSWKERKPALFERVLILPQYYDNHEEWGFPGWEKYFKNPSEKMSIEYCSGNGDWIIQKALDHPDENWIAVEKKFPRIRKIWSKMKNHDIENLLIVCGEANEFTKHYLPDASIDQIFINFPDPWPKDRHAKHRLVQNPFVEELKRISKEQGKATFVTDDLPYRDQMIGEMQKGRWKSSFSDPFYTTKWQDYGPSWFEKLWREKGRTFYYMQFEKMKEITLPASLSDDLHWDIPEISDTQILWHLDFGPFDLTNSAHFHSNLLAVEQFVKQIWENHSERTSGVILTHFEENTLMNLEQANHLSDYLHRLASFLPDECPPIIRIETSEKEWTQLIHFFCLRRFEYFHLEFIGKKLPVRESDAKIGVVIPSDETINLERLSQMISSLDQKNLKYQCIPEELLNEHWGGLETLLVDKSSLSDTGQRMLNGFEAAGGNIISHI